MHLALGVLYLNILSVSLSHKAQVAWLFINWTLSFKCLFYTLFCFLFHWLYFAISQAISILILYSIFSFTFRDHNHKLFQLLLSLLFSVVVVDIVRSTFTAHGQRKAVAFFKYLFFERVEKPAFCFCRCRCRCVASRVENRTERERTRNLPTPGQTQRRRRQRAAAAVAAANVNVNGNVLRGT